MEVEAAEPIAGPSRPSRPSVTSSRRKFAGPHPSRPSSKTIKKHPAPLPPPPSVPSRPGGTTSTHPHLPIKVLQGVGVSRTDTTKPGYGREVLFVTRKSTLGSLIGRGKSLIVNEGYTHLVIHALGAAIPHAFLLLHALLDCLPYPRGPRGLWYEIKTGSVECVDEVTINGTSGLNSRTNISKLKAKKRRTNRGSKEDGQVVPAEEGGQVADDTMDGDELPKEAQGAGDSKGEIEEEDEDGEEEGVENVKSWLAGIGSVEADEPERSLRIKSSVQIDIFIGPKPSTEPTPIKKQTPVSKPGEGRARPNKKRRMALAAAAAQAQKGEDDSAKDQGTPGATGVESKTKVKGAPASNEEDEMNGIQEEAEEEVEQVEVR